MGSTRKMVERLQKEMRDQRSDIDRLMCMVDKLRALLYEDTRLWLAPSEHCTVGKAIHAVCDYLNVHFEYIYPAGWELVVSLDDDETKE